MPEILTNIADLALEAAPWLLFGLVLAGAIRALVTPLAASLLFAGVSPGTVLVFLLAGPATNLGTVGIIRREFGQRMVVTYLVALAVFSIGAGLLTDVIVDALGVDITAQLHERQHLLPL